MSPKSKAALIRVIARQGHSDISLLAIELGLDGEAVGANRLERSMALVRAIEQRNNPDDAAGKLFELVQGQLSSANERQLQNDEQLQALIRNLELDGYAFRDGRLLPATPTPIALQEVISDVERDLDAAGYDVALKHYQQAVDNYVKGNWEAANSQVRSFLEDLFIGLCQRHRNEVPGDAGAALQHLYHTEWLDRGEYNHYRAFWNDIQDNGPHRGLSSEGEGLFRLHYATAVARYLLSKET
jgi:hypothetical protein